MSERETTLRAREVPLKAAWPAALLAAGLCLAMLPADARGGQTGRDFLELCSGPESWTEGYCTGYVTGAGELIDGLLLEEDLKSALASRAFCLPNGLRKGQVRDLVLDYLRAHPEVRDKQMTSITWAALIEAFPCS
ncbi:MAG: Rap1a/Tai family immunity protein [Kiloniellales bacterium]|nr:Rap1a/Tai family immunity protein [Kiloniellales bacterium]